MSARNNITRRQVAAAVPLYPPCSDVRPAHERVPMLPGVASRQLPLHARIVSTSVSAWAVVGSATFHPTRVDGIFARRYRAIELAWREAIGCRQAAGGNTVVVFAVQQAGVMVEICRGLLWR
jgi:hypothetical protein